MSPPCSAAWLNRPSPFCERADSILGIPPPGGPWFVVKVDTDNNVDPLLEIAPLAGKYEEELRAAFESTEHEWSEYRAASTVGVAGVVMKICQVREVGTVIVEALG